MLDMTIGQKFLQAVFEPRLRYKGVPVSLLGIPVISGLNRGSVRVAISRLKKNGYVTMEKGYIKGLPRGWSFLNESRGKLPTLSSPFKENASKNLLVIFDIPENQKFKRDWLRSHLKLFGYVMLQQSAWIGPSPLPRDFMECLDEYGLRTFIKTFKLAKNYVI